MSLLVESAIKGSAIVALALVMMPLLRRAPAAYRHWLLSAALLCAAITPVVVVAVPSWRLPIHPAPRPAAAASAADAIGTDLSIVQVPDAAGRQSAAQRLAAPVVSLGAALRWTWLAGAAVALLALLAGFGRLGWIAWRARHVTAGAWSDHAARICRELGIERRITVMEGRHPTLLVTWGLLRPKLLVPSAALRWADERIRLVLYHELAHVRRGDWVWQLAAELLRAVYWFSPIFWIACRRLRDESEHACDDAVLNRGVEGPEYALNLVGIVRELTQPRWTAGAAIARTSNLERRVRAMLDSHRNRRPVSRRAGAATLIGLLAVAVPIGGLAARQAFTTLSGSIVDPMSAALPGVKVVLTNVNSQAKYEVQSDRTGHYEVGGLAPGDYLLEARLPGFAMLKQTLTIAGQSLERNLTLQVGSVQESIVVSGTAADQGTRAAQAPKRAREKVESPCGTTPAAEGVPVGGNLRAPAKLKDVKPDYPPALRDAGVGGTIVLRGRLGSDGFLHDLTAEAPADARLAHVAIDAASQWEFAPTLLNCQAIDIPITITVSFRP